MLLAAEDIELPVDGMTDTPAAQSMGPPSPSAAIAQPMGPSPPPPVAIADTPIKLGSSTMLPYTTHTRCRVDTVNAMGYEMKDYIVGPMPPKEFLQEFLPTSQIPYYDASGFTSTFTAGTFSSTLSAADEQGAYEPFVSIPGICSIKIL